MSSPSIRPVNRLSKQKYLLLESQTVENNASQVYFWFFLKCIYAVTYQHREWLLKNIEWTSSCKNRGDDQTQNISFINNICNDEIGS